MRPGVKGWGDLITEADRYAALQIPEETLKSMSTHDLIITCLNLPVMSHYAAFNTLQQGMDVLIQNFNGLQELMKRDDAPLELLTLYRKMDTKTMKLSEEGVNQAYWNLRRGFFEMLLAQEPILEKMDETTRLTLIKEAQKRIYQKIDDEKEYSSFSYRPTLVILKKSLNKFSDSSLDEIKKIESDPIIQFLKQDTLYVNLMSSSPIYSNVYISTPNGTSVAALKLISGDMSQGDKDDYKDSNLEIYDNRITFAGEATYAYNCHAYAWYVSEGYSYVWLNTPGDDAFWNDGSYVLTTDMSRAKKVSYASDDHSAIIASQNGYFKSKWGAGPLFIHKPTDCPYNASTLRYYRYPDPNYDDVPSKPLPKAFNMISSGAFTAEVSNDARYEVDLYEWKVDYPNDWSIVPLNTIKSKVNVYQSSSPRSCYLYARAHNSFGWGEWQSIGWVYVSNSYSLSVLQNSGGAMLQVQIKPNAEMQNGDKAVKLENQTYQVALYSNTGVCVYQTTVNNNGTNVVNLNIDVSQVSNGVYFLNVRNTKANEGPQTMNIMIKH